MSNFDSEKYTIDHLKYLQDIIKRMSDNSFKVKGWCITLVSALLALLASNKDIVTNPLIIVAVPLIGFWILDAYYLMLERKFRIRYENDVKEIKSGNIENVNMLSYGKQLKYINMDKFISFIKSIIEIIWNSIKNFVILILEIFLVSISPSIILTYIPLFILVKIITNILFK